MSEYRIQRIKIPYNSQTLYPHRIPTLCHYRSHPNLIPLQSVCSELISPFDGGVNVQELLNKSYHYTISGVRYRYRMYTTVWIRYPVAYLQRCIVMIRYYRCNFKSRVFGNRGITVKQNESAISSFAAKDPSRYTVDSNWG